MTKINKYGLKHQLNELLKANKKITIDFNCGNDEAHIVPFVDGTMVEYGELYFNLEELIYTDLNLPSAGSDTVTGTGYLTMENNDIFLVYDLEGFYIFEDDFETMSNDDYQPRTETKYMTDKYLLLSSEYDDAEKLKEYLEEKETTQVTETLSNNFTTSDQELWDRLKGTELENTLIKKVNPWWKFW